MYLSSLSASRTKSKASIRMQILGVLVCLKQTNWDDACPEIVLARLGESGLLAGKAASRLGGSMNFADALS